MLEKTDRSAQLPPFMAAMLSVVKSSWKSLLAVASICGLAGLLAASLLPASYTSIAVVRTEDPSVEAVWRSPEITDRVLRAHPERKPTLDQQRQELIDRVRWTKIRVTGLPPNGLSMYRIEVVHEIPAVAQSINTALLESWRLSTKPRTENKRWLEEEISRLKREVEDIQASIRKLEKGLDSNLPSDTLGKLYELKVGYEGTIDAKMRALEGLPADVIISPPTLPNYAQRFSGALAAALAALAGMLGWGSILILRRMTTARP